MARLRVQVSRDHYIIDPAQEPSVKVRDVMEQTEAQFATFVEDALERFGWRWVHFRPARTQHGWRTAVSGHKGFPDYVAVRPPRLLFIEIKGTKGHVEPEQFGWLGLLNQCTREHQGVYVWWPRDHEQVIETLK